MNTIKRIALSLIPGIIVMVLTLILASLLNDEGNAWYTASIGGVLYASGWYVALTYWKDYQEKPLKFFGIWTVSIAISLMIISTWLAIEKSDMLFGVCMFWNAFILKYSNLNKKNKPNS